MVVLPQKLDPEEGSGFRWRSSVTAFLLVILVTTVLLYSNYSKPMYFKVHQKLSNYYRTENRMMGDSYSNNTPLIEFSNDTLIILLWTPLYSRKGTWIPQASLFGCPEPKCVTTSDRRYLNNSAAVIFHLRSVSLSDIPPRLNPNQRWVLYNREAPPHTPSDVLLRFNRQINITVTYRKDSDVYAPYGWVAPRKEPVTILAPVGDRKLVCWLVSNCHTPSQRETYVQELKEFIPVDIYGKCGDHECERNAEDKHKCYKTLSQKYKFYLSFENSICKGYATEKLFYALLTDMVPVVMGGEDYPTILPPNSYIDALNFTGPRQLAEYLKVLDKDDKRFMSYLSWKKDYEVVEADFRWVCDLCRKLETNDTNIHSDLTSWWSKKGNCTQWYNLVNSTISNVI